uniref:Keratin 1 n=1 Tax=Coturnix japonica TaxID=93934 RepID=A0A8C2SV31_COTJA
MSHHFFRYGNGNFSSSSAHCGTLGSGRGFPVMSHWEDDRGQRFGGYGYGYGHGYGSRSLHNLSGFRNFSTGRREYFVRDFQGGEGRTYGGSSSRGMLSGGLHEQGAGQGLGHTAAGGGIEEVHVNTNLLRPIQVQVDPEFQRMRSDEKEQIKTLNNKFASFIDKVQCLERQNQALMTKWELLQQQSSQPEESRSITSFFQSYINNLQRQLDTLQSQKEQLDPEAYEMLQLVEDYKKRFEDEINKRTSKEEEYGELKKVKRFNFSPHNRTKTACLECENPKILFSLQELSQLQTVVDNTNVILSMDNGREVNMDGIIEEVRQEYERIAQKGKDEVSAMYQGRYQDLQNMWVNQREQLRNSYQEIQELTRQIQRLQPEIETVRRQNESHQEAIRNAEQRGSSAVKDGEKKLQDLENALQQAREDLAQILHDYQELLNAKLALDIEIEAQVMGDRAMAVEVEAPSVQEEALAGSGSGSGSGGSFGSGGSSSGGGHSYGSSSGSGSGRRGSSSGIGGSSGHGGSSYGSGSGGSICRGGSSGSGSGSGGSLEVVAPRLEVHSSGRLWVHSGSGRCKPSWWRFQLWREQWLWAGEGHFRRRRKLRSWGIELWQWKWRLHLCRRRL